MGRNARLMYHAVWGNNEGDVFEQQNYLEELKRFEKVYNQLVAKHTGKSLRAVEALYLPKRKDHYMQAQECLKFGFVDKLI